MATGDSYKNLLLDAELGADKSSVIPDSFWLALFKAPPSDAGGGLELVDDATVNVSYERVEVVNDATMWDAAVAGSKSNLVEIAFPSATSDWETATNWGLYDSATAGNLCRWGPLVVPITIADTEQAVLDVGALVIRVVT